MPRGYNYKTDLMTTTDRWLYGQLTQILHSTQKQQMEIESGLFKGSFVHALESNDPLNSDSPITTPTSKPRHTTGMHLLNTRITMQVTQSADQHSRCALTSLGSHSNFDGDGMVLMEEEGGEDILTGSQYSHRYGKQSPVGIRTGS